MGTPKRNVLFLALFSVSFLTCSEGYLHEKISRKSFPQDFLFGSASAAYQVNIQLIYLIVFHLQISIFYVRWYYTTLTIMYIICIIVIFIHPKYEGAAHMDGRGNSIWDTFTRDHPGS